MNEKKEPHLNPPAPPYAVHGVPEGYAGYPTVISPRVPSMSIAENKAREAQGEKDGQKENPAVHPPVSDPPVPNRAHTEMRTDFPSELPLRDKKTEM